MAPCLPCTLLLFDSVPKTIALPKHSKVLMVGSEGRFSRTAVGQRRRRRAPSGSGKSQLAASGHGVHPVQVALELAPG
jgi:hypothetical protein